jgi:hypothetical protein
MTSTDLFSQITGRATEAFSLWADANQKILRELVDLSASTAREGVRLYAEMQSGAVEAVKEGQGYLLRRQGELAAAPREPWTFYERSAQDSVESTQKAVKLCEDTAQAMTRAAERLQVTAEQTGREIQATFTQLADRMRSLYSPLA